ncbi:MAG TPA: outer membrane protein assembly factor BamD [Rhodanobacteraceae bacterium]|nr:outer membrane protein assembly factor BamD [Rhodanobacteraceae bacterium]
MRSQIVRSSLKIALLAPLLLALAACSFFHRGANKGNEADTLPVDQLYNLATKRLESGNYDNAEKLYQRLIARFPYGDYNEQAQIDLAYAYYKDDKPDEAYSAINRFIKTYPAQKHIDYAYYLRGLINFDRTGTMLERFSQRTASRRDQGYALQSFDDFSQLVQRFPTSRYTTDARQRMIWLRNGLAQFELNIAEYYLRRKAYVASADRAEYVIEHYQRSPQVADALAVLAKSYKLLGRPQLAGQTESVLKLNYPDHPYLRNPKGWPKTPSIWRRAIPLSGHY